MSAKRPRPAIPVLVHVDNPTEAGSVTVDTSTIEGKMDTVITNQNRIYDKIPTSSGGGGSADLTTVNEKITSLATSIGPASSTSSDDNIFGHVRNLHYSVGDAAKAPSLTGNSVRDLLSQIKTTTGAITSGSEDNNLFGFVKNISSTVGDCNTTITANASHLRSILYNIRQAVGSSTSTPTATETTVRGLLTAIKENTASGGDLTTVNENTTTMKSAIGTLNSSSKDTDLIGCVRNLRVAVGASGNQLLPSGDSIRSFLFNLCKAVGNSYDTPTSTENTIRGLLLAIKENTASGSGGGGGGSADLTTVNEKTTALAAAIGSASDDSSTVSVIGLLKSITDKY